MISVMKRIVIAFAVLFLFAIMIYYSDNKAHKHVIDKCTAYDYITQKQGCRSEAVAKKFPDIILNTKDPKKSVYDPNRDLKNGYTLLTYAIYRKNYKFAQQLINNPKTDLRKRDKLGNSILTLLLQQKKYDKASYVYETLGVRLTDKERRLFVKHLQSDRKKGDERGTEWAREHDILIESDELVNWKFADLETDEQTEYVAKGVKLTPKNIEIFRKNFADQPLSYIYSDYDSVKHLLSQKERKIILHKILNKDIRDYDELLKSLLNDGINLNVAYVNKLLSRPYDDYENIENKTAEYLVFYLYHNCPNAFRLNEDLVYALRLGWYDLIQSYINNGAVDTHEYKTFNIEDSKDAHVMQMLLDNGYSFTKEQHAQYQHFVDKKWIYEPQLLRSEKKPLLIVADGAGYLLAVLNTQTHQLTLQKYNEMQQLISAHPIKGKFYDNKANHLIGLYPLGENLLLLHRRIQDRSVKTVLTVLSKGGEILKSSVIDGDYKKILFQNNGIVVQTEQIKLFFDKMLNKTAPFNIPQRSLQARTLSNDDDNVWTKYLADKTLRLDFKSWNDKSILYIDPVAEKKPVKLILTKQQNRVLDIAQSKDAAFLLEQQGTKRFVVKLDSDFGNKGYHYIYKKQETKQDFPYKSSMDTIKQTLRLKNNGYAVVGKTNQMPSVEIYDDSGKQLAAKAYDFGYLRGHISNVLELESGDLLIVGRLYESLNVRKSFSALLNANGNPKWSRIYHDFGYLDHPSLVDKKSFLALAYYTPTKFSLTDGAIEERYKEAPYAQEMLVGKAGRLYLIGNKTIREDQKYEPVIYCYSDDKKSYTKKVLDTGNFYIKNLYQKDDALHAWYKQPKTESSLASNLLDIEITPQCEVDYTWKK